MIFNLLTTTDEKKILQFSYNFYFQGDLLKEEEEGQQGRKCNKNGFQLLARLCRYVMIRALGENEKCSSSLRLIYLESQNCVAVTANLVLHGGTNLYLVL